MNSEELNYKKSPVRKKSEPKAIEPQETSNFSKLFTKKVKFVSDVLAKQTEEIQ